MRTFARDGETNDLTFGYYASKSSGGIILDANVETGRQGVLNVLNAIVRTAKGELVLNTEAGIDHVGLLANGSSELPFWRDEMEEAVTGCDYVTGIESFEVDADVTSGVVSYRLQVTTTEGDVGVTSSVANLAGVRSYGNAPK